MDAIRLSDQQASRIVRALFGTGLLIAILMLVRSQVGGDQLNLLARGWLLAAEGKWISYGNPMSTGGKAPGGITSVLVGLPLMVWRDHRAPVVVILLFHVFAYWILDGTLRRILSPRGRVLLAVLYWLNPWQLYFASFLWNPNYLFLLSALHLWSCLTQRERGRFWPSFLHTAGLALAFQIHASFLLLAMASFLLWLRGYFKVHWPAAFAGGLLAALPEQDRALLEQRRVLGAAPQAEAGEPRERADRVEPEPVRPLRRRGVRDHDPRGGVGGAEQDERAAPLVVGGGRPEREPADREEDDRVVGRVLEHVRLARDRRPDEQRHREREAPPGEERQRRGKREEGRLPARARERPDPHLGLRARGEQHDEEVDEPAEPDP